MDLVNKRIDEVIHEYVRVRNTLDAKRKEYQEFEKDSKTEMEVMSMWLRDKADELGVDSFNTEYGTAYRSTKTYARVGNWDKVLNFIKSTDNWQMLEKRIAKLNTIEVLEETGLEPSEIGIEFGADVDMLVRKS